MTKELIIFDLDGTLINTDILYTLGWKTILKGYGVELPEATLAQMNGQSTEKNNAIVNSYLDSWDRTLEARNKREGFVLDAMEMGLLLMKPGAQELSYGIGNLIPKRSCKRAAGQTGTRTLF
ncbi:MULTISPECIES: HAD hydrolase-like protein [Jeotgalibaca]|uniref:HAD hydrolase-like protein n=1 Tax=Jeotgalibaca TaxID=1470540 RepID=UPI0035A112EB